MTCPECGSTLEVPDAAAGKRLRCKNCQAMFRPDAAAADAARPTRKRVNDDEDDRPRPRPRRAEGDADDADDRPARRPASGSRLPLVLGLAGLGILLVGGAVAAFLAFGGSAGSREFTDPDGVFTASFPGKPKEQTTAAPQPDRWGEKIYSATANGITVSVEVLEPGAALEVNAQSAETILAALRHRALIDGNWEEIDRKSDPHRGHPAEQMIFRHASTGWVAFFRAVVGGRYVLRLIATTAGASMDADKARELREKALAFFDRVEPGPAFGPPVK
ncbi:MAG TPA: hypothetical protein VM597_00505 [Gemmataceae bacterium]|nr:hypothetical protein [Gemmataceae bacterium]